MNPQVLAMKAEIQELRIMIEALTRKVKGRFATFNDGEDKVHEGLDMVNEGEYQAEHSWNKTKQGADKANECEGMAKKGDLTMVSEEVCEDCEQESEEGEEEGEEESDENTGDSEEDSGDHQDHKHHTDESDYEVGVPPREKHEVEPDALRASVKKLRDRQMHSDARTLLLDAYADRLSAAPKYRDIGAKISWGELKEVGFVRGPLYEDICDTFHSGSKDPRDKSELFLALYREIETIWAG
jgi:hypothetical protein